MKTKILLAILAITLVLTMAACGGKKSGNTYLGTELNGGTPNSATLANYGVSEDVLGKVFDGARAVNTSDANYKGWYEEKESGMSIIYFIWANKTEAKFKAVSAALVSDLSMTVLEGDDLGALTSEFPKDTILASGGMYDTTNVGVVMFFKKAYDDAPAGTLVVAFMTMK